MMNKLIRGALRQYFTKFPVQKGKWHAWEKIRKYYPDIQFPKGIYSCNYNFKMYLDDAERLNQFIYFWGDYEPNEAKFIRQFLKSGDVFVDVGANEGYFSLLACAAVGNDGHVFAIEAVPDTVSKLTRNTELNGFSKRVTICPVAASGENGYVEIFLPPVKTTGMNSMRKHNNADKSVKVPCKRVDDVLGDIHVNLIKIDIEGAELLALRGMTKFLEKTNAPPVLCEVTDSFLKEMGASASELYKFMDDFGYKPFVLNNGILHRADVNALIHEFQVNVVFKKRGM